MIKASKGLLILGIIGLIGAICDRLWFALDNSIPAWDQADYLNGSIVYWQALQSPQWFNGEWWRNLWLLSPKIPPLTYLLTVPFFNFFGVSVDTATLVMQVFSVLLLVGVYGLGVVLFNVSVGLWAAGLCLLMPGLYYYRLEFLLDFPLTAIVTFSFYLLTLWYFYQDNLNSRQSWLRAIGFGISFGLALMVKQTALFFLILPILWAGIALIMGRLWIKLAQLLLSLSLSVAIIWPWSRTNWLLMLTSGKRATIDSALIEGDPSLASLDAWTYYARIFPYFLSWPLLLVPIVGFLMGVIYWQGRKDLSPNPSPTSRGEFNVIDSKWIWLSIFIIGGYLLSSLNINKDARYILPLYPVFSLVLAVGLLSWRGRWQKLIRWGTIALATLLMLVNIFPLKGEVIADFLSPKMAHHPYLGEPWPNSEVISEIVKTTPYLRTTLGVLPSTPELNQHTFSFYGGKVNRQVVGRQVGVKTQQIEQDARSLDWFITKTDDQGSIPEAQPLIVKRVEQGADFQLQKQWTLPDQSTLSLYHRTQPTVEVNPFSSPKNQVQLAEIIVPERVPPGQPIPVTYTWVGAWSQLKSGIVILTWKHKNSDAQWIQDHGIGMGALFSNSVQKDQLNQSYEVIERTAMLPDKNLPPGEYNLTATYLNRDTGETYPIAVSPITITLDPKANPIPAPELDLVTQLRLATTQLDQGIKGLEPVFTLTGRINQYDATQDYVKVTDQALSYRLKQENDIKWAYGMAISRVLQQDIDGAIAAFKTILELNPNNPYHYAYLAFVYLYDWQPHPAQQELTTALKLNPHIPELKTLHGVAALMQGNIIQAWHDLKSNT
ncbi:glycosyl transferase family 39 [Gloeothece citriformis PCC 7424]|uniref:Glycosyl transferase family 39 n=1 Tax=Gloeothece citriformis (strain PCC 7424) TaxID=65393 RepID=B7KCX7_GLOC7|nr:glycosyltransferase family 39 protein [Gloeothece citriformis]ACK73098.1 glycosyl transferase family 39 [Gloeothece citriformis PCC 7424]